MIALMEIIDSQLKKKFQLYEEGITKVHTFVLILEQYDGTHWWMEGVNDICG